MPNIKLRFTDMQTILFNDYKISISGTPLYDNIIEKSCFIALHRVIFHLKFSRYNFYVQLFAIRKFKKKAYYKFYKLSLKSKGSLL